MYNMVGFVPNMYIPQTIYDNREKHNRSARRNYERMVYEFAENGEIERVGDFLDDEIRKISTDYRTSY